MEIVFYRSKEKPTYYLLYKGKNGVNAEKMFRKLTNAREFEDSGFERVEVELAYILKTELNGEFFDFLAELVSSNHIEHSSYNDDSFKAWYEFKNYEPEKWLKSFQEYYNSKIEELMKNTQQGLQTKLF
jgi:hypothetical protein